MRDLGKQLPAQLCQREVGLKNPNYWSNIPACGRCCHRAAPYHASRPLPAFNRKTNTLERLPSRPSWNFKNLYADSISSPSECFLPLWRAFAKRACLVQDLNHLQDGTFLGQSICNTFNALNLKKHASLASKVRKIKKPVSRYRATHCAWPGSNFRASDEVELEESSSFPRSDINPLFSFDGVKLLLKIRHFIF